MKVTHSPVAGRVYIYLVGPEVQVDHSVEVKRWGYCPGLQR